MSAFDGAPLSLASRLTVVPVVVSFVTSTAIALVARSTPPENVWACEQELARLKVRSDARSPPPLRQVPAVRVRPVPTTEVLPAGDCERVIVRSVERSPPPLRAVPLVEI